MQNRVADCVSIIQELGLPRAQHNERTGLALLALLNLGPEQPWSEASNPLRGITPVMDFIAGNYNKVYAPNTRETFRKDSVQPLVAAGVLLYNPDDPQRAVNSPKAVYQVNADVLAAIRTFGTDAWAANLANIKKNLPSLAEKYQRLRLVERVSLRHGNNETLELSAGPHSLLIKAVVEDFGSVFAPGGKLLYVGDTGDKWVLNDAATLKMLNINVDEHGKMPDVIIYLRQRNWLLIIEAVTSSGPVNARRHMELRNLFKDALPGLVFVTAFPSRQFMARFLADIAWETEVWTADAPTHLIHFNGERFLGPYHETA